MKRDWQLIREILKRLEAKELYSDVLRPDGIDGYDPESVSYHMLILDQAGLIVSKCKERGTRTGGIFCLAINLTWEGHELLDKIRSESIWNKTVAMLKDKSADLSYEAVKAAASSIIAGMF